MSTGKRLITEARVVAALIEGRNRFDLAHVLWAIKAKSRTRVLEALLDGPKTSREVMRWSALSEPSVFWALKGLSEAGLVVSRRKIGRVQGGPMAHVYEIFSGKAEEKPQVIDAKYEVKRGGQGWPARTPVG